MNICLNSMFQEKCYPIRGIITLMYETNVYTCPCEIKYRFNLNHYDDSENRSIYIQYYRRKNKRTKR